MKCDNYSEWMSERLDGVLDPVRARRLDEHLQDCAECRREWRELERSWQLLGQLPELEPSPIFRAQVWEKVRLSPPQPSLLLRWRRWWSGAGLALAGLALVAGLSQLPGPGAPTTPATRVAVEQPEQLPALAASDWDASVDILAEVDYLQPESNSLEPLPLGDLSHDYLAFSGSVLDETLEGL